VLSRPLCLTLLLFPSFRNKELLHFRQAIHFPSRRWTFFFYSSVYKNSSEELVKFGRLGSSIWITTSECTADNFLRRPSGNLGAPHVLEVLEISGLGPLGLSQQFETHWDSSTKVIHVEVGWLCSFEFKVTSSRFELKENFSSLVSVSALSNCLRDSAATCSQSSFSLSRRQAPQKTTSCYTPKRCGRPKSRVQWVAGSFLSHFSFKKSSTSRVFSSPMVECRGTGSLIPCGMNSYPMWKSPGWLCIPASYVRTRSVFHSPSSL